MIKFLYFFQKNNLQKLYKAKIIGLILADNPDITRFLIIYYVLIFFNRNKLDRQGQFILQILRRFLEINIPSVGAGSINNSNIK
jgi:hypothetical protein